MVLLRRSDMREAMVGQRAGRKFLFSARLSLVLDLCRKKIVGQKADEGFLAGLSRDPVTDCEACPRHTTTDTKCRHPFDT